MKPCVLLTFCQLLGHSKARTGRGLACTVCFACVNDLQVHFQWLQHANRMVHPTGSLFHMSSLACIYVRNTIHLSWCHLSAAGDARPSARPTSRAAPTTRRLAAAHCEHPRARAQQQNPGPKPEARAAAGPRGWRWARSGPGFCKQISRGFPRVPGFRVAGAGFGFAFTGHEPHQ